MLNAHNLIIIVDLTLQVTNPDGTSLDVVIGTSVSDMNLQLNGKPHDANHTMKDAAASTAPNPKTSSQKKKKRVVSSQT